jgi:hypothetical protein
MKKIISYFFIAAFAVMLSCGSKNDGIQDEAEIKDEAKALNSVKTLESDTSKLSQEMLGAFFTESSIDPDSLCSCRQIYDAVKKDRPHPTAEWHVHQDNKARSNNLASSSPIKKSGSLLVAVKNDHKKICYMPFFNTNNVQIDRCDHIDKASDVLCLQVKVSEGVYKEVPIAFNIKKGQDQGQHQHQTGSCK